MRNANSDTLKAITEAFNAHDLDAIMEFFADDCVLEMPRGPDPWGRRLEGREPVREGLASPSPEFPTSTTARIATGSPAIAAAPNGS